MGVRATVPYFYHTQEYSQQCNSNIAIKISMVYLLKTYSSDRKYFNVDISSKEGFTIKVL